LDIQNNGTRTHTQDRNTVCSSLIPMEKGQSSRWKSNVLKLEHVGLSLDVDDG